MAASAGGGGCAGAPSGVSGGLLEQQPSSSSSSIRSGYGRSWAPVAAWKAAARRTQPGSRWRRPEASQGGVRKAHEGSRRSLVCMPVFHAMKKSWDRVMVV